MPAALRSDGAAWAFLENAGGSRVPDCVADAAAAYFRDRYVQARKALMPRRAPLARDTANASNQSKRPQLGAGYEAADCADATVAAARRVAHALCAEDASAGFAALGASTSAMLAALAAAWAPQLGPGDVVIVSSAGHESNITPWVRCAKLSGARLAWWHPAGDHGEDTCPLPALHALLAEAAALGERVRVVAFPHVSNLLGGVTDVAAIAKAVKEAGAASVCDGVAFAPHAAVDAPGCGLSFYAFSFYKTYGPHLAVLYGTHGAWGALREGRAMPNHAFITAAPAGATPAYAFELGGPSHEACAALAGLRPYLLALAADAGAGLRPDDVARAKTLLGDAPRAVPADDDVAAERRCIRAAFAAMAALERGADGAATPLREFLEKAHADGRLRLLGPRNAPQCRVPTFSFVPIATTPAAVVAACHAAKVACRNGHMYAPRLLRSLGIATDAAGIGADGDADGAPPPPSAVSGEASSTVGAAMGAACGGVVRVSAVHYNTRDEALRCIAAIDAALGC
jgi:selenocysteine lyase/cysteine desulfurase